MISMDPPILAGRAGGFSTFGELCDLLSIYGVSDAVLLDGGASAQMFINTSSFRRVVNPLPATYGLPPRSFSDVRFVANAIGVVDVASPLNPEHLDTFERRCGDAVDDDGDGAIDCADDDCLGVSSCGECANPNCTDVRPALGVDRSGGRGVEAAGGWERVSGEMM